MPNHRKELTNKSLAEWLREKLATLGQQVVGAILTTITLSVGYMVFNDYISAPPNVSGSWKFTMIYKDTTYERYKNLQVTYQVLLMRKGLDFSGSGEKLSDRSPRPDVEPVNYTGDTRTNLEISGSIVENFFSQDIVTIHYSEQGRIRPSSTVQQLVQCGPEVLCGCFRTTISDSTGYVWWERRGNLKDINKPVGNLAENPAVETRAKELGCFERFFAPPTIETRPGD